MRSFSFVLAAALVLSHAAVAADSPPSAAPAAVSAVAKSMADTATIQADIKAGAPAAQIAADASVVSADATALASAAGVATSTVKVAGHVINLNLGGAAVGALAFPSKSGGTSVAGGGGGALRFDVGVGQNTDGSDHWHIALDLGITSLTYSTSATAEAPASTISTAAAFVGIVPAYQPSASAPAYGFGPIAACPLGGTIKSCIVGLSFSAGFAALVHQSTTG